MLGTRLTALIHFLKENYRKAISPCKSKAKIHVSFNSMGVTFALVNKVYQK